MSMKHADIAQQRLQNQHITDAACKQPDDVVRWLGAVQAQDYTGAKWAIGLRTQEIKDADVDRAFTEGTLLRTHVLRATWHFVTPEDIRWLLALTAPHIHATNAFYYRKMELDDTLLARAHALFIEALRGGKQLTRAELRDVLERAGIAIGPADTVLRLSLIVMHAELDGIICSGAKRDKQFTYALLDEQVPASKQLARDEALAKLTRHFFTSHGPATLKDYMKWSGLPAADARTGLAMVQSELTHELIDGKTYWFASVQPVEARNAPIAYLLSNYDEYFSGYADYSAIYDPAYPKKFDTYFPHSIVIDGQVVGVWKRIIKKESVIVVPKLFTPLSDAQHHALTQAVHAYSAFLEMPVVLEELE